MFGKSLNLHAVTNDCIDLYANDDEHLLAPLTVVQRTKLGTRPTSTPQLTHLPMPRAQPKELCTCVKCLEFTVIIQGVETPGRLLTPYIISKHKENERRSALLLERQISCSILAASASESLPDAHVSTFPARRGNIEDEVRKISY